MKTILSNQVILSAADDAERMLLCAILRDAGEYVETLAEYRELHTSLEGYEGLPYGINYPLTVSEQDIIKKALKEAIAYRTDTGTLEGRALVMAYREIARALGMSNAV